MTCAGERGGWIIQSLVTSWGVWKSRAIRQHPHGERDPHGRGTPIGEGPPTGEGLRGRRTPMGGGPPQERDPHGKGMRSHWVEEDHGARLEATGPVMEPLGLCTWEPCHLSQCLVDSRRSRQEGWRSAGREAITVHTGPLAAIPQPSPPGTALMLTTWHLPSGAWRWPGPLGHLSCDTSPSSAFTGQGVTAHGAGRWEAGPGGEEGSTGDPGFPGAGATAPVPTGSRLAGGEWRPRGGYLCWHPSTPNLQPQSITKRPGEGDSFSKSPQEALKVVRPGSNVRSLPRMRFTSAEHVCKTAGSPTSEHGENSKY